MVILEIVLESILYLLMVIALVLVVINEHHTLSNNRKFKKWLFHSKTFDIDEMHDVKEE